MTNWGSGMFYFTKVYCVYDYVHIFKNVRNNWITIVNQQLSLEKVSYVAA